MSKTDAIRLLLVRVGPTEWDAAGRLAGATDLPLSEEGASALKRRLEELGPLQLGAVLHAGDEASTTTGRSLADLGSTKARSVPGLREVSLGLWEGMKEGDLQEKCPTAYRRWREDPVSVTPPEGETMREAQARLVEALRRGIEKSKPNGRPIALVLRPLARALVVLWLDGRDADEVWKVLEDAPTAEWRTVPRERLKRRRADAAA